MARNRVRAPARDSGRRVERTVAAAAVSALLLPYVVLSFVSGDAVRESKLLAQAIAAAACLVAMAAAGRVPSLVASGGTLRTASFAAMGAAGLCVASAAAAAGSHLDPLAVVPIVSTAALFLAGASPLGPRVAGVAFPSLMLAGALTGLLAALQRFAGILQLPFDAPEPRFLAAGLVGNPGDLGAALVFPGILLIETLARPDLTPRLRLISAVGLAMVLAGIGASAALGPFLALVCGALLPVVLAPRRRLVGLAAALVLVGAGLGLTDAGARLRQKANELAAGRLDLASTQRDIGALAAIEMIRSAPVLGVGPGAFSNAFVPARLAAEERWGRRLVHRSASAHFENAHAEPLTIAAECGVPAALLGGTALLLFLWALLAARFDAGAGDRASIETLAALLAGFAVLSVSGFPSRLAITAGPFAFAAGLAWARSARAEGRGETPTARPARLAAATIAAALLAAAAVRGAAVYFLADGEGLLQAATTQGGAARESLLTRAARRLELSSFLRPRDATALLALGSARRLSGDLDGGRAAYLASLALEERGETVLNLGLLALQEGRTEAARALFERAVWILPRLASELPPEAEAAALQLALAEREAGLGTSTRAPALPPGYGR